MNLIEKKLKKRLKKRLLKYHRERFQWLVVVQVEKHHQTQREVLM